MKYIAAYAMCVLGGKAEPTEADVDKLLKDAGVKGDADHTKKIVAALKGKKFHELVSEGMKKMNAAGPAASAGGAKGAPAAKKAVVEEVVEEAADVDMGGLFGDDY
jgi:large subunit ribosomal protein LP2